MNNIYEISNCCRACLRIESPLTSVNMPDDDSIKFCDKLIACISDIVRISFHLIIRLINFLYFRYGLKMVTQL